MRRALAPCVALLTAAAAMPAAGGTADRCTRELGGKLKPAAETRGGDGADNLSGTDDKDRLLGLGAGDVLLGSGGDDCLLGGDGDDRLDGQTGADDVEGQAGADTVFGGEDSDLVEGNAGGDTLGGGDGDDALGVGSDQIQPPRPVALSREERFAAVNEGELGDDRLDGGPDDDALAGGPGADVLIGGGGADQLEGGPGRDRLEGGAGPDLIGGGQDRSTIDGGPGNDAISSTNGVRDSVRCGSGRDRVRADRGDRLRGCEQRINERSPFPEATPPRGRRTTAFHVRARALFPASGKRDGSFYEAQLAAPRGCPDLALASLVRVRRGDRIDIELRPSPRRRQFCRGRYEGALVLRVFFQESDSCGEEDPAEVCNPGFDAVIGRFSFRVR